jgi:hypothetical protein
MENNNNVPETVYDLRHPFADSDVASIEPAVGSTFRVLINDDADDGGEKFQSVYSESKTRCNDCELSFGDCIFFVCKNTYYMKVK